MSGKIFASNTSISINGHVIEGISNIDIKISNPDCAKLGHNLEHVWVEQSRTKNTITFYPSGTYYECKRCKEIVSIKDD